MVRSQNWPRLFVDIFFLKLPCIRYQKTQIPIFEDFLKNKNLTKICFKMVSYKVYHRMNWSSVTKGLFWDQESRINSVRTMKKKAKTIDRSIQNLHMFLCKMTTLLRVTFQACKSSTVPRQHYILKSSSYCLNIQPHSSLQNSSKKTATPEKNPQKYNQSWKTSVFRRHYWVLVPLKSIKYRKFDQNWSNKQQIVARVVPFLGGVTTGQPRLMEMPADHFSADPFPILFVRLSNHNHGNATRLGQKYAHLWVKRVIKINFLPTISRHNQEKRLRELINDHQRKHSLTFYIILSTNF